MPYFRTACMCAALALAVISAARAADNTSQPRVRIVLVGDSTVAEKSGWGPAFAALLSPGAECLNHARGGRSSKSYFDEGLWQKALAARPNYVLIQFGHNDQPGKGPERETDPNTTYRVNLARYVDQARESGAVPVLVTPLARRVYTADGKVRPDLEPYAEAVKAVAAEKQVPLVDLYARSVAQMLKIGRVAADAWGPPHPQDPKKFDGTHLSAEGARAVAALVAAELGTAVPELAKHLPADTPAGTGAAGK